MQTGCGRLGTLFAYELYGVEPDIMTLGKGIGGGVPLSAFLAKEHAAVFTPGDHGSTYGGEPLTTRVGYEVMRYIIENDIPADVARKGRSSSGASTRCSTAARTSPRSRRGTDVGRAVHHAMRASALRTPRCRTASSSTTCGRTRCASSRR